MTTKKAEKPMTKEELAAMLDGREYGDEITSAEASLAKASQLVVIFGASDDLAELRGAIDDEVGGGGDSFEFCFDKSGTLLPDIDDDDADVLEKYGALEFAKAHRADAITVKAVWCATKEYSWTYETSVPHATFNIMEDGEKFCRGIVIDLKEAQ